MRHVWCGQIPPNNRSGEAREWMGSSEGKQGRGERADMVETKAGVLVRAPCCEIDTPVVQFERHVTYRQTLPSWLSTAG